MNKKIIVSLFLVLIPTGSYANEQKILDAKALAIVKQFGGALKPQLKAAMKNGGPVNAINVCSVQAPAIAKHLSNESGWVINRVSLKARNTQTAMPDAWESKILHQFEQQQIQGVVVKKMALSEIISNEYRYMKPQAIEPVCLHCHGENIKPDVQKALRKYYPNDKATGYRLGDIRGAFSLRKKL